MMRQTFLAHNGYEVVCARDGRDASRLLGQETFDLVITDSELPLASGWEVAAAAKERAIPVILSSGWPVRLRPEEVVRRGVDFVASKPCGLDQLLHLVEAALKKSGPSR